MKKVNIEFDTTHATWNVMLGRKCIYHTKDVTEIDTWLDEHEGEYYEG